MSHKQPSAVLQPMSQPTGSNTSCWCRGHVAILISGQWERLAFNHTTSLRQVTQHQWTDTLECQPGFDVYAFFTQHGAQTSQWVEAFC